MTQPMTEQELIDLIVNFGNERWLNGHETHKGENGHAPHHRQKSVIHEIEIKQQLSLLYAERERWEILREHMVKNKEAHNGFQHIFDYVLRKMSEFESTQTETKTEGQ